MASRKRILKTCWWTIICFSTTGFLIILQWNFSSDQSVSSSERQSSANTSAPTEERLASSTSITETILTEMGTENVTTLQYSTALPFMEIVSLSTKATTNISTSKAMTQKTTQLMASSITEFDESSTLLSSFQSTYDVYITSSPLIYSSSKLPITKNPGGEFFIVISSVSSFGIITVLLLALIIFFCSRHTTKQNNGQLEVSEDGWNGVELDETRMRTANEKKLKEQNVAENGIINSPMPRLSISSPTEMRYATVNQTFATFTPGPEKFRKIRDRNSKIMKTGVAKGLMYSEPDLLNNTIPSLKLSVNSPKDTLQWEPNVAYQGFNSRIYHSTENNFIGSYRDDFSDDYYAVIDM